MTSERERQIRSLLTRHEAWLEGVDTADHPYHRDYVLTKALRDVLTELDRMVALYGNVPPLDCEGKQRGPA